MTIFERTNKAHLRPHSRKTSRLSISGLNRKENIISRYQIITAVIKRNPRTIIILMSSILHTSSHTLRTPCREARKVRYDPKRKVQGV